MIEEEKIQQHPTGEVQLWTSYYTQYSDTGDQDNSLCLRDPTSEFDLAYRRLRNSVRKIKSSGRNAYTQLFRVFKVPSLCILGFMSKDEFYSDYSEGISACYVFRFKYPHPKGYTHGLCIRVDGYAPRRLFDKFAEEFVRFMSDGTINKLYPVTPNISKRICLFDYLQSLYVVPSNLLINYSNQKDALPEMVASQPNMNDHQELSRLTSHMKRVSQTILENMVSLPLNYCSILSYILTMPKDNFKNYMKFNTINDIVHSLCQDSYNQALQDSKLTNLEIAHLMEPLTRRSMVNKFVSDKLTKAVQELLQQTFAIPFVHPHPYVNMNKGSLPLLYPFDAILFDPRFLLPVLMCSRWFAKSCMRKDSVINNNNAHLVLYGQSGAGKSLLLSIISSNVPTYRYLTGGRFQNPDVLTSALMFIDELDTTQLMSNTYKGLLDIKAPVKFDFKNLHPENVTEGMPCMISTNDDILSTLHAKKTANPANSNSVEAAIRRLYIVPFKLGQYDKLHGQVKPEHQYYSQLCLVNRNFDDEADKLSRIFNFIMSFALFQTDISNFQFDASLQYYFNRLVGGMSQTVFGVFYVLNKNKVDSILQTIEAEMIKPDINDSEYLTTFTMGVGNLARLISKFLKAMITNNSEIDSKIVKDTTVPWPVKMYYVKQSSMFLNRVHSQCNNFQQYVNPEVFEFIRDKNILPYSDAIMDAYADLDKDLSDGENEDLFELEQLDVISPEDYIANKHIDQMSFDDFMNASINFDNSQNILEDGLSNFHMDDITLK